MLLDAGRSAEALSHLQRAASGDPGDAITHALMGLALVRLEQPQKALEACGAAAALDPELELAHRLRAIALNALGQKREANAAALEACRLEPREPRAHLVLATTLERMGDQAGALAAARHAVELDPYSADAHNQVGVLLLGHERHGDAGASFQAALALDAEHADALNNLSVVHLRRGNPQQALGGFEQAASLDPRSQTFRSNILSVGGARAFRRAAIVIFLVVGVGGFAASGQVYPLVLGGIFAGVCELARWNSLRSLDGRTRALVADDARARRFVPSRWDWKWPTRFRPWWWTLLSRIPPIAALALNAAVLAAAVAGRAGVWIVAMGLALPFSIRRAYKWWRRQHPAAGSWRPGGGDR